ncbi:MAG TPA: MaoC/PaaZ C-terminal domain-containing protein, partial [Candidatus Dormibacteraeota bacterium]|nr:MaoC/PaaZ C-terminal domain-containing protein [Candidatus Dormibacteraeota bacterium]
MSTVSDVEGLKALVGKEWGPGEWLEITQERIDAFADATDDHQWIHVDVERAKKESPFGGPIAHGYLTLSLLVP